MSTEGRNPKTTYIDRLDTAGILGLINDEDATVAGAVRKELPTIARVVDVIVAALQNGGRLIYTGAGTSGRMAVIDAAECYPTFGIPDGMVQAVMAGGEKAFVRAIEGAEDDEQAGKADIGKLKVTDRDVVCGISASGNAPYVVGTLKAAKLIGTTTVSVVNNINTKMEAVSDINVFLDTGEEVIKGSTRMKAGSSQKICLNMISTACMIKLGRVYENLMVDMRATNNKLVKRAVSMVREVCGCNPVEAEKTLELADWSVKTAIVMLSLGITKSEAEALIKEKNFLYNILQ